MPEQKNLPPPAVGRNPGLHLDAENERKAKVALCMNTAMLEILKENRIELIRRARLKLKAMGVELSEDELKA